MEEVGNGEVTGSKRGAQGKTLWRVGGWSEFTYTFSVMCASGSTHFRYTYSPQHIWFVYTDYDECSLNYLILFSTPFEIMSPKWLLGMSALEDKTHFTDFPFTDGKTEVRESGYLFRGS